VPVSGSQNGSPSAEAISRNGWSRPDGPAMGRRLRRGANNVASSVARFVIFTIRCSRTAATDPNVRSSQPVIAAGGSVWPTELRMSYSRSSRARP
jgi:hypothetical protein